MTSSNIIHTICMNVDFGRELMKTKHFTQGQACVVILYHSSRVARKSFIKVKWNYLIQGLLEDLEYREIPKIKNQFYAKKLFHCVCFLACAVSPFKLIITALSIKLLHLLFPQQSENWHMMKLILTRFFTNLTSKVPFLSLLFAFPSC